MGVSIDRAYWLKEWETFTPDETRLAAEAEIRKHLPHLRRVLDVGCGAGQELRPYLGEAVCVGVDADAASPEMAAQLFQQIGPPALPVFIRATAEALPIGSGQIDLVISRLVLPYTHVASAIAEVARVLRTGGLFSVQFHSALYYLRKALHGAAMGDRAAVAYAFYVLRTGAYFHASGSQRRIGGTLETFLTLGTLTRLAATAGLDPLTGLGTGSRVAPHLLFRRR